MSTRSTENWSSSTIRLQFSPELLVGNWWTTLLVHIDLCCLFFIRKTIMTFTCVLHRIPICLWSWLPLNGFFFAFHVFGYWPRGCVWFSKLWWFFVILSICLCSVCICKYILFSYLQVYPIVAFRFGRRRI